MKCRSLISNKMSNATAILGLLLQDSIIALKETGATTFIDGLIRNGHGKEESV